MAPSSVTPHEYSDRQLRVITVFSFVPGMILLAVGGISTKNALPYIGMIPTTFSALLGLTALVSRQKPNPQRPFEDLILAIVSIAILIPTYVLYSSCSGHYRANVRD